MTLVKENIRMCSDNENDWAAGSLYLESNLSLGLFVKDDPLPLKL